VKFSRSKINLLEYLKFTLTDQIKFTTTNQMVILLLAATSQILMVGDPTICFENVYDALPVLKKAV